MAVVFNETWPGADGSPWPAAWSTTSANGLVEIDSGRGLLETADVASANARGFVTAVAVEDQELFLEFQFNSVTALNYLNVWVQGRDGWQGTYRPMNGVGIQFQTNSTVARLYKNVAGTTTELANAAVHSTAGVVQRLRLRAEADRLKARVWVATDPEPGAWQLDQDISDISGTGTVYVSLNRTGSNTGVKQAYFGPVTVDDLQPVPGAADYEELRDLEYIMAVKLTPRVVTASGAITNCRRFLAASVDSDAAAEVLLRDTDASGQILAAARIPTGAASKASRSAAERSTRPGTCTCMWCPAPPASSSTKFRWVHEQGLHGSVHADRQRRRP